jgi:hypothetical protein
VRQWAKRGSRLRQPTDQRYENGYLFRAICPARGKGAALALPFADTAATRFHLFEISRHVAKGAHAVLLLDQAGWHMTDKLDLPANITIMPLHPNARNSTSPKTSGSSWETTGSPTAGSNSTTTSSTIAATHGMNSSNNPGASCSVGMRDWRMGSDQGGLV